MIVSQHIGEGVEGHFVCAVLIGLDCTQIACAVIVYRHYLGNAEREVRIENDIGLLIYII